MRVLFCNIAWMKYYKGIFPGEDEPNNGGSYVLETGNAHEKYNFEAVGLTSLDDGSEVGEYCLGFVETKSTNGKTRNQLHLENIDGCQLAKNESEVEDVLVIYCAAHPYHKTTFVVGWYKHATVYRDYMEMDFPSNEGDGVYPQAYNAIAKKSDCTLMPVKTRIDMTKWKVPRKKGKVAYGFGSSNVWFATDDNDLSKAFVNRIVKQIEEYDGENWIDKYPE